MVLVNKGTHTTVSQIYLWSCTKQRLSVTKKAHCHCTHDPRHTQRAHPRTLPSLALWSTLRSYALSL
jgi:hypothetical protein